MSRFSRRDFLKFTGALSLSAQLASWLPGLANGTGARKVLILLFDTLSARHLSLYGYPRETTPELSRFAERAMVYHSHYSSSNFTSPATASLFTGMYPWKHRAYNQAGLIRRDLVRQNLFALLGNEFHRFSFAQTEWAHVLMNQFSESIERNLPPDAFSLRKNLFSSNALPREKLIMSFSPGTIFEQYWSLANQIRIGDYYQTAFPEYPKGPPVIADNHVIFKLGDVFNGVFEEIRDASARSLPHFSYYHLFAPHGSYRPTRQFMSLFKDDHQPLKKPAHPLGDEEEYESIQGDELRYDQYIANVDYEFGLLMKKLEDAGLLEDTYVIVTSDHGELLERGTIGHATPLVFDSVIHIPLLIRLPEQTSRSDIYTPTSTVDLLPTLLSLLGKEVPLNVDGRLLPGFGGQEDAARVLYSMYSPRSSAHGPLRLGTFAVQQAPYKLIYYKGYKEYPEAYELYNLAEDPDEIDDLFARDQVTAKRMKDELLGALSLADERFQ